MSVNAEGYRNESFESLETAVMETPRGRWFLEEYAKRQRSDESLAILEVLRGLEKSISNTAASTVSKTVVEKPIPHEQMKFFRRDEEIFSQPTVAPGPALSIVGPSPTSEAKQPAEPKGAKLKIQRANAMDFADEPNLAVAMPELAETPTPELVPVAEPPSANSAEPKQRIVIIRRPASEVSQIPMIDDKSAEAAA